MADENPMKAAYLEAQRKLKKDIRPMMARSGWYNPDKDPDYVYQRYPITVRLPDGKEVIAHTEAEEKKLLGIKDEPAKTVEVDIANLVSKEVAPKKRGRPPKAAQAPLPPNLE